MSLNVVLYSLYSKPFIVALDYATTGHTYRIGLFESKRFIVSYQVKVGEAQ